MTLLITLLLLISYALQIVALTLSIDQGNIRSRKRFLSYFIPLAFIWWGIRDFAYFWNNLKDTEEYRKSKGWDK